MLEDTARLTCYTASFGLSDLDRIPGHATTLEDQLVGKGAIAPAAFGGAQQAQQLQFPGCLCEPAPTTAEVVIADDDIADSTFNVEGDSAICWHDPLHCNA